MPRIWTENVPVEAVPVDVRVSVLVVLVLLGPKDAVTPAGKPEADKLTLPVKPFWGVTATVEVTVAPRPMLKEFGERERAKFGAGITVRDTAVTCAKLPDVPLMVTAKVPRVAVLLAVNVSALVAVVLLGMNVALTPLGKPDAESVTALLKPLSRFTVMVVTTFVVRLTLKLLGAAESV